MTFVAIVALRVNDYLSVSFSFVSRYLNITRKCQSSGGSRGGSGVSQKMSVQWRIQRGFRGVTENVSPVGDPEGVKWCHRKCESSGGSRGG